MSHAAFTCVRQTDIETLNIKLEEYHHITTGAKHFHIVSEDNNNVFLVAFLTVPQDSTGVAHILEHTTLCGSQRYPVRDPFFLMIRRSLNTFMNAFTSNDWTAYPFASQNTKDFDNLLQVYLDAVFFPHLHALDFAQEGHRLEFESADNPNTPLVYKGIVYNEMKGAMSSPIQILWHSLFEHLFPTVTYHHNSGGDPQVIPELTLAQLKAFHANHYHPSNAVFMTYGDRPASEHQALFETCALQHFEKKDLNLSVPDEQRYTRPQQFITTYPVDARENGQNKTHILLAWLLGHASDTREVMNMNLLEGLLLDNSASPLQQVLETTKLGTSPSILCGFSADTHETLFTCGLEGSNPEHADAVEQLILQVLEGVTEKGVPQSQVESVLHQIELQQREVTGDHFPYGLQLLLNTLGAILHGGNPVEALDIDSVLQALREDCRDPQFVPNLIKRVFLDNPHRIRLIMKPDPALAAQQTQTEREKLDKIQAQLSESEKADIIEQTKALQIRQQTPDDMSLLPKVTLADIPETMNIPQGYTGDIRQLPATWFARGTNGMVYQSIVMDLPAMDAELIPLLPLFCDCMTEVGCGDKNYLETATWQSEISGGISARISVRGDIDNVDNIRSVFSLSGKALVRHQANLTDLLYETLENVRFDELSRLQELVTQIRNDWENSVTERGHHLVMAACNSGISATGALMHHWHGLAGLQTLKALDDSLKDETALRQFAEKLGQIRDQLLASNRQLLVISEETAQVDIRQALEKRWQTYQPLTNSAEFELNVEANQQVRQIWTTNTQVNYCAKAYATVPMAHPDAPVLMVLGDFMRNGYLHQAIREQGGAYGGGASYETDTGAFRFFSYRDPHLEETLNHFDNALVWLQEHSHEARTLEEAILNVISKVDKPGSPAGEAIAAFFGNLYGRTEEKRQAFRQRLLQVTLEDLQRVGRQYLQPENAHIAVLSHANTADKVAKTLNLVQIAL